MRTRILEAITDWCIRHGRHRTIYDRDGITPYMERYYLLFKDRPRWFPFNITLHKICRSDLPILHDHPWPYMVIILKGGYIEHTLYDRFFRGAGHIRVREAESYHWLEVVDNIPTWSLFFMGKRKRDWGFLREDEWMEAEEYLDWRRQATIEELKQHHKNEEFLTLCRMAARESIDGST